LLFYVYGCEKPVSPELLPQLTTTEVTIITEASAISGGLISGDGGYEITVRGVCWSTNPNPTTADSITKDAAGTGRYVSKIVGLKPNTTYYLRAYATNKKGTAYGLQESFTTKNLGIVTKQITDITTNCATSGGNVISVGSPTVTARGVCWSTSPNPTVNDYKTTDGIGAGTYISSITGLLYNTIYYVRAYATNSDGTTYGNEISFKSAITIIEIAKAFIPAGTFSMGSPIGEVNRMNDERQFQVTMSAFRMSKYEITNAQFAEFLNVNNIGPDGLYSAGAYPTQKLIYSFSIFGLNFSSNKWIPVTGYEKHPVVYVTWYGATEFATYVGGTLPTEAQWEYACRAGTTSPFNTGSCLTNFHANYDWNDSYNNCINTYTTSLNKTQSVGTYPANSYGLYDMHGNVWEWCSDWYGTYPTTDQINPTGASTGSRRVIRGGSCYYGANICRSAFRSSESPYDFSDHTFGFRVAFLP
jgi:formylglycine-generating enzyme required for sulfatase activity